MTATTAFAATAAGHTTSTYTPFTNHWTTYLTLSEKEKPAFFKYLSGIARQVAGPEIRDPNLLQENCQDFSDFSQNFSNFSMAGVIFSLARRIAQNPNDSVPPAALDRILEAGVPVDICDAQYYQMTALFCMTSLGDESATRDAMSLLLDKGAFIDAPDQENQTPLHVISLSGRTDLIRLLVEHGANVNHVDLQGYTPLSGLISAEIIAINTEDTEDTEDTDLFKRIELLASHPDIDWSLPGNSEKPIAILQHRIESTEDEERKAHLRAMLSLIQEPLIAHLQQQLAQRQLCPVGQEAAFGDRAPS
jgi:hypothetical protein